MFTITETIDHGTYHAVTVTTVAELTPAAVAEAFAASPYTYNTPAPDRATTYAAQLAAGRDVLHGWSTFTADSVDDVAPAVTSTCGGCGEPIVRHEHDGAPSWCGERSPVNVCRNAAPGQYDHRPAPLHPSAR